MLSSAEDKYMTACLASCEAICTELFGLLCFVIDFLLNFCCKLFKLNSSVFLFGSFQKNYVLG